ncbi:CaiB/BaiF CoA transferase family protein [Asanoa iriomotensis]|uniref:Crotonobetainyl-CoA:carnitine CoA-transferase CaiB-like acyl-CoA transferase n=1 Tax=Asanoa iriomotensis TaxID=234613 RepID=A0ABQ4C3V8_9ACTN|nr:CoA transferase [Asanoa iriomotensis]GIF57486.1 hypothetical protein Air01nite_35810 [Asanoa iriomotensis]
MPERDAFAGIRVLDLGSFWAGPYLGSLLGAMGADVLKVEGPRRVDGFRFLAAFPQQGSRWYELSGLFQATNLNKRGLTLDLGTDEGRAVFERLVADADVVIENFSPRVVEQFGFGYPALAALNPRILMVRMPGYGLEGSWREFVGFGNSFEYAGGIGWITGDPDGPPLGPGGYADPLVAMHGAVALVAALQDRERTGRGQLIELVQAEVVAAMTPEPVLHHALTGEVLGRTGSRSAEFAPQGVYPCRGEDEWLALTVRDEADWKRLVAIVGEPPGLPAQRLSTLDGRQAEHDALDRWLFAWTRDRDPAATAALLQQAGIPAAKVLTPAAMYGDPQLTSTGYYQSIEHPLSGIRRYPTWPFRYGDSRDAGVRLAHRFRSPLLGEHNEEILRERLGMSPDEIDELRRRGVISERMLGTDEEKDDGGDT